MQRGGQAASLGKGVQLPTCSPGVFYSSCLASACFPHGSSCSPAQSPSLQALGLSDAGLPVPNPKPSPPAAAQSWHPLPWSCLSSTPPSTLFCLKHFNIMGQQLRGCLRPFLEALSTFREEGRDFGLLVVSTLHHGLCLEAAGLANPAEVSRAGLCPALTLLPSADHYE